MKLAFAFIWWATTWAYCAAPDQEARWKAAKLDPKWREEADSIIFRWERLHTTYERLEAARTNGVPAQIILGMHMRECDNSMTHHLHEGSPLAHRTVDVPKGRPPVWNPPNDWYSSALDALYIYEHLDRDWNWIKPQSLLQGTEKYNGLGYQANGHISPYLWSGTTIYKGGKYVRDHVFSTAVHDEQIGICAVLLRMRERGMPIPLALDPAAQKAIVTLPALIPPAGLIVPPDHSADGWITNFLKGFLWK